MNYRKIFICLWPLIILAGIPVTIAGCDYLVSDHTPNSWNAYMEVFFHYKRNVIYSSVALLALFGAIAVWLKKPSISAMVLTIFTGWVICGFPGMVLNLLMSFRS